MKLVADLNLGFNDAENYQRRENKKLFNDIFVKNNYLEELIEPSKFFLIGEKGTGKTAYSVFLSNNNYKENISTLKYIRETDYQKFVALKKSKHLQLSDYDSIWKVIILLLLAGSLNKSDFNHNPISKRMKMNTLLDAIDNYYMHAFSPEIISALQLIDESKLAAETIFNFINAGVEHSQTIKFEESRFQMNLLYIQKQFENAFSDIKLKNNHILFIDGIDIRPGQIPYADYLDCVKGLANAVWSLNNDFFPSIKDSKRLRVVLLLRPDIFNSIGFQNQTNKLHDNSVYLDWRTTYEDFETSELFFMMDNLLNSQQKEKANVGEAWGHYFPWYEPSSNFSKRDRDSSFLCLLRYSYCRPRDLITMIQLMKSDHKSKRDYDPNYFQSALFHTNSFKEKYSRYLMGGIKDQLSFYYDAVDYDIFLKFFMFLNGKHKFEFDEYKVAYNDFIDEILKSEQVPKFVESPEQFLQFLYESNIISFREVHEQGVFDRWCYRERCPSNITPKVKLYAKYQIHHGLFKALNVGRVR